MSEVSLHGRRLLLTKRGLKVDGRYTGDAKSAVGKTIYVDSATGASGSDGLTPDSAVTTIDIAIGLCTANQGDVIIVMPNHAETITAAGGITADVAGISIVGMGTYNQRPRVLLDTADTVTVAVTAADVTFENIVFASGHADIATCFNVTGVGCTLIDLEFVDNVVNENFVTPIKATGAANTADGLKIIGCRNITLDANAAEFLELTDNIDHLVMLDNVHLVTGSTAGPLILSAGTKIQRYAVIGRNLVQNANTANDVFIDNGGATNSGIVFDNYAGNLDVTGAQTFGAATGLQFFNNQTTSTSTDSGALNPVADTPLS